MGSGHRTIEVSILFCICKLLQFLCEIYTVEESPPSSGKPRKNLGKIAMHTPPTTVCFDRNRKGETNRPPNSLRVHFKLQKRETNPPPPPTASKAFLFLGSLVCHKQKPRAASGHRTTKKKERFLVLSQLYIPPPFLSPPVLFRDKSVSTIRYMPR